MGREKIKLDEKVDILKTSFDASDFSVCVTDKDGLIQFINFAFLNLIYKENKSGIIGASIFETIKIVPRNEYIIETWHDFFYNSIDSDEIKYTRNYDLLNTLKRVPISIEISNFIANNEKFFIIKVHDISKEIEKEKIQDEFISTVSHEMRTPATAINGYIELALNQNLSNIDQRAREYLESAFKASTGLNDLFQDILEVSRLDNGKISITPKTFNVANFLKAVESKYAKIASRKNHAFAVNIESENIFCHIDPTILENILDCLIDNAVKFTDDGGNITLKLRFSENQALISVSDNGVGIRTAEMKKIFDKFFRANGVSNRQSGAGLGLYIAKRQTELMGGKITVESKEAIGSDFTVAFPIVAENFVKNSLTKIIAGKIDVLSANAINNLDPFDYEMAKNLRYPKLNTSIFVNNFIRESKEWLQGNIPSTTMEEKIKIKKSLQKLNPDLPLEKFNEFWYYAESRFDNVGLAKASRIMTSNYLLPWALKAPKSVAWEAAFGWFYNIAGEWEEISKKDIFYWFAIRMPEFVWSRERTILARKELSGKKNVLFLKAGCLPELRYFSPEGLPEKIIACDDDESVPPNNIFGWSPSAHGVTYYRNETFSFIESENKVGNKYELIIMNSGSCQYHSSLDRLIPAVVKLLEPGGKFMFDIQPTHWDIDFSTYVLGVRFPNESTIPKNINEVILNVMQICDHLPGVSVKYTIDKRNDDPAGIMFYIEKQ